MVNRYFDDFISNTHGSTLSQYTMPMDANVRKEVIKFTFDGNDAPVLSDRRLMRSDLINVSKFKSIEIFIKNRVRAGNVHVGLATAIDGNSGISFIGFYDWENEKWVISSGGQGITDDSRVLIRYHESSFFMLSTHPNFYWLKSFNGSFLRLDFMTENTPTGDGPNTFEAWLVGEKNV